MRPYTTRLGKQHWGRPQKRPPVNRRYQSLPAQGQWRQQRLCWETVTTLCWRPRRVSRPRGLRRRVPPRSSSAAAFLPPSAMHSGRPQPPMQRRTECQRGLLQEVDAGPALWPRTGTLRWSPGCSPALAQQRVGPRRPGRPRGRRTKRWRGWRRVHRCWRHRRQTAARLHRPRLLPCHLLMQWPSLRTSL